MHRSDYNQENIEILNCHAFLYNNYSLLTSKPKFHNDRFFDFSYFSVKMQPRVAVVFFLVSLCLVCDLLRELSS